MTFNLVELALHPAGHECVPGVVGCSFRESVYGTLGSRDITFTEGTGLFSGALLVVNGRMSDTEFRRVGKYMVALADQSPACYHRQALGQQVIYQCRVEGQLQMPPEYEDLFQGQVALVRVKDGLDI